MIRTLSSILILCTVLISPLISLGQGWHSAKFIKSANAASYGTMVATDQYGNYFMTANYSGEGVFLDSTVFLGVSNQTFIISAKYDSLGTLLWGTTSYNMGSGYPINSVCDKSGNLFVFGMCNTPFNWQGHSIIDPLIPYKYFLVKINPSGAIVWLKSVANIQNTASIPQISGSVSVDDDENIYVTGGVVDSVNNIEGHTFTSRGGADIFINKYNKDGVLLWTKNAGGSSHDLAWSIATTRSGNFYVSGVFSSDSLYIDSSLLVHRGGGLGAGNIFISKFDSSGHVIWSRSSIGNGMSTGIATDVGENVYLTGVSNDIAFDSFSYSNSPACHCIDATFITKYNALGSAEWIRKIDRTGPNWACGIAIDECNNLWTTYDLSDHNNLSGQLPAMLVEYSPDGTLLESERIECSYGSRYLAVDPKRNIYLASTYMFNMGWGGVYFNIGANSYFVTSNAGDGYIAKYVPAPLSWDTVYAHSDTTVCSSSGMTIEPPAGYLAYLWDDGTWSSRYTISRADTHTVFCYPSTCASPILAETIHTHVDSLRTFSLGADTASCVPFYISAPYSGLYLWQDGSTSDSIEILTTGTYALTISEGVCTFSDTINVIIDSTPCSDSWALMPNAFTPNNDGTNDRIRPFIEKNSPVSDYSFTVYNKYGLIVFNTTDPAKAWDGSYNGRTAETGVYIYNIKYNARNGSRPHNYTGNITLVR